MDIRKKKIKGIFVLTLLLIISMLTASVLSFSRFNNLADALVDNTTAYDFGDLLLKDYDKRTDGKVFDGDQISKIFEFLTAKTNANYDDVKKLGVKNSDDLRNLSKNVDHKNLIVTVGGLKWNIVYLSNTALDNSGDVILTLWLTSGLKQSKWNNYDGDPSTRPAYPANLYGTSYIRAVTLNNGGNYHDKSDGSDLKSYTKSPTSDFAAFTVDKSSTFTTSLTSFIEAPANVQWQERLSNRDNNFMLDGSNYSYNYSNDAYATDMGNFVDSAHDYQGITGYSNWKNDKIWLPAMAETGWNQKVANCRGLWRLSNEQRGCDAGGSWSRSADHRNFQSPWILAQDGASNTSYPANTNSFVRPAFHLNLSKVAAAATSQTLKVKGDTKKYYNETGGVANDVTFELENVDENLVDIKIEATDIDGNSIASPTYTVKDEILAFNANKVGKYVVKAKPKTGQYWSDGTDKEKDFTYYLKYHVAPLAWKDGKNSSEYNAEKQYFEVENYDEDKMTVTPALEKIPEGQPNAGKWALVAMNYADKSKVKVELKNTEFMEWTDDDTSSARESMTYSITKKTLTATSATADAWSVETNTSDKQYDVYIDCFETDINDLRFEGYYQKDGSTVEEKMPTQLTAVKDGDKIKVTVTLPELSEKGTYKYTLKLKTGIEANNNYALTFTQPFKVESKKVNIKEEDVIWRYTNGKIGSGYTVVDRTKLDADKVYNVDYNGGEYVFDVDTSKLSTDVEYSVEGEKVATNVKINGSLVGYYTATFKITAKAGSEGIEIETSEFTLKWRINKAKVDLSETKWDYTKALPYNDKMQEVVMTGIPSGLTFNYKNNKKLAVANYTAEVISITLADSVKNNYIRPEIGNSATYIGDIKWTLDWEITKCELELDWERKQEEDANGKSYWSWEVSNTDKVDYLYYTDESYADGAMTGSAVNKDTILVPSEQEEKGYWIVAVVKDTYANNYEIKGTKAMPFTVGSLAPIVAIEMEKKFVYDGNVHGREWYKAGTPGMEYVEEEYYRLEEDGSKTLLEGAPKDTGKYIVKLDIQEEYRESYQLSVYKIGYAIVKAEIELTLDVSEYKYDGNSKEIEIKITGTVFDVNKLIMIYYNGNEIKEENKLRDGELPINAGEYLVVFTLNAEDGKNYEIKAATTQFIYKIIPVQIKVKWDDKGKTPVLDGLSEEEKEKIEYEYYDENGNKVEESELESGNTYKVVAKIKDEYVGNYEFVDGQGAVLTEPSVSGEYEFEYKDENPDEPTTPVDPNEPNIPNNPDDSNNNGGALDEILAKLKELPIWQLIASGVSIVLILLFTAKGIGYASKRKENKRIVESKYKTFYATTGLFGLSMTNWTIIASVLMGVAVLSFVFMLIEKRGYKKSLRELEDAKDEYARNREEMLYMRMSGNNGNMQGQGYAYAQPSLGADEIRGIVSDTMTAMLPNVQQYLPQQAQYSENEEKLDRLMQANEMLMQKLTEQSNEKEGVSEEVIERLVEKLSKQREPEKVVEKEVAATVVANDEAVKELSKSMAELKEIVKEMSTTAKTLPTENPMKERVVEYDRNSEKIEMLMRNQEILMQRINDLAINTALSRQTVVQQPAPQIVEKVVEKPVEKIVEVPVEKIVEKEVVKEVKVEVPVEVEKVVEKIVEIPAEKPTSKARVTAPRLTLDEAYAKLSAKQKKFFDTLKEYAMSKDKCKEKKSTYYILLGQSSVNPLVKLTIKKDCTVALFKMEDEYMKDIRRNATNDGTKVKVKETELIVGDAQALATAKEMIDLREDQIERYNDFLKEQRSLKKR